MSTGVFNFPVEEAAGVALAAVSAWREAHPGRLELVVFDVFSERDERAWREAAALARRD